MNKTKIYTPGIIVFLICLFIVVAVYLFVLNNTIWPLISCIVICFLLNTLAIWYIFNSYKCWYSKASWTFIISIFPIIGLLAFFIFGINPLRKKTREKYLQSQKYFLEYEDFSTANHLLKFNNKSLPIFSYGLFNMHKAIHYCNIKIIDDNSELFYHTINLIRCAKQYINIQCFIINFNGFWTRFIFAELIKKANEGVKIRLIYDWVGIHKRIKQNTLNWLRKYGIEVACFNPKGITKFKATTNYRIHSKFIIVDNKICMYGGSNLSDEYLSMSFNQPHWQDLNFIIHGPIVTTMNITFINYWINFTKKPKNKYSNQNMYNDTSLILAKKKFNHNNSLSQLLVFDPNYNEFILEKVFCNLVYNAKKSIKILTPYFCMPPSFINALRFCHNKKIDIQLIAHNKNQRYVQMINRENYSQLINWGIKVYEYDGYLHSKCVIIDDEYALVGSCNFDYRSIYMSFESAIIVYDKQIISKLIQNFHKTRENSLLLTRPFITTKLNLWTKFILKLLNVGKSLF